MDCLALLPPTRESLRHLAEDIPSQSFPWICFQTEQSGPPWKPDANLIVAGAAEGLFPGWRVPGGCCGAGRVHGEHPRPQQGKKDLRSKHVREVLVHPDSKLADRGWFLRWEPRPALPPPPAQRWHHRRCRGPEASRRGPGGLYIDARSDRRALTDRQGLLAVLG